MTVKQPGTRILSTHLYCLDTKLKYNMLHFSFCKRQRKSFAALGCLRFYLEGGWKQLIHVGTMRTSTQLETKRSMCLCAPDYVFFFMMVQVCLQVLHTLYSTLCACQCAVCMSTSLPIPIRYQYTLSPTSIFKPFRFPYI